MWITLKLYMDEEEGIENADIGYVLSEVAETISNMEKELPFSKTVIYTGCSLIKSAQEFK